MASEPGSSSGTLPRKLTTFAPFSRLPFELKQRIYALAIMDSKPIYHCCLKPWMIPGNTSSHGSATSSSSMHGDTSAGRLRLKNARFGHRYGPLDGLPFCEHYPHDFTALCNASDRVRAEIKPIFLESIIIYKIDTRTSTGTSGALACLQGLGALSHIRYLSLVIPNDRLSYRSTWDGDKDEDEGDGHSVLQALQSANDLLGLCLNLQDFEINMKCPKLEDLLWQGLRRSSPSEIVRMTYEATLEKVRDVITSAFPGIILKTVRSLPKIRRVKMIAYKSYQVKNEDQADVEKLLDLLKDWFQSGNGIATSTELGGKWASSEHGSLHFAWATLAVDLIASCEDV